MPKFLLPIRSGRHRVAAIALFRALLSQCRALSGIGSQQREELQNLIRNRFKQARHVQSNARLRINFEAGYEAVDHLDAAVAGSEESKGYILQLLDKAHPRAKQTPPIVLPKTLRRDVEKRQRKEAAQARHEEPRVSLFERPVPLEQLSGKRHVPILASANSIPFLRIKKPQPESLSAYLSKRIKTRQKRHDMRQRLEAEVDFARHEDTWDSIVSQHKGVGRDSSVRWSSGARLALRGVQDKLTGEKLKNQAMAEKMQAVVDREQELFDKERAARSSTPSVPAKEEVVFDSRSEVGTLSRAAD